MKHRILRLHGSSMDVISGGRQTLFTTNSESCVCSSALKHQQQPVLSHNSASEPPKLSGGCGLRHGRGLCDGLDMAGHRACVELSAAPTPRFYQSCKATSRQTCQNGEDPGDRRKAKPFRVGCPEWHRVLFESEELPATLSRFK